MFWVYVDNMEKFEEMYRQIASEYDIPGHTNPKEDIIQLVRNWLESKYRCLWLIIIDNVDDTC